MLAIHRNIFHCFYFFVPLCYFVYFFDKLALNEFLLHSQYRSIYDILPLAIVFNLPHILASSLLLGKYRNLANYKHRIEWIVLLCSAIVLLLMTPFKNKVIIIFGFWTAYHVVAQQFGVIKIFGIQTTRSFSLWKWLGISTAILILLRHTVDGHADLFSKLSFVSLVLLFLTSIVVSKQNKLIYQSFALIWVNFILAASSVFFDQLGYYLLVALLNQFVHDVTAFYFYIVHNLNFEFNQKGRWLNFFEKSTVVAKTLVLPIALCLPLSLNLLGTETLILSYFISLIHYTTESFIWNRSSPLRLNTRIA